MTMTTLKEMTQAERLAFVQDLIDATFETTLGKRVKTPHTIQANGGDYPANAIFMFLDYGHQRKYNDRVGGEDTPLDKKIAQVEEMMARFKSGDIGRQASAAVDPLTHECRKIARAALKRDDPAGFKRWDALEDVEEANARLDDIVAAEGNEWIEEEAKLAIKQRADEKARLAKVRGKLNLGDVDL